MVTRADLPTVIGRTVQSRKDGTRHTVEDAHADESESNVWLKLAGKKKYEHGMDYTLMDTVDLVKDELLPREKITKEARRVIMGDRATTYGDATASFARIAALWSPILGVEVTPQQAALCLVQLKVSRAVGKPDHADSYVDMVGYAALAGEVGGAKL